MLACYHYRHHNRVVVGLVEGGREEFPCSGFDIGIPVIDEEDGDYPLDRHLAHKR